MQHATKRGRQDKRVWGDRSRTADELRSLHLLTEGGEGQNLEKEAYVIYVRLLVRNPSIHVRLALHAAMHSCRHGLKRYGHPGAASSLGTGFIKSLPFLKLQDVTGLHESLRATWLG